MDTIPKDNENGADDHAVRLHADSAYAVRPRLCNITILF